MTLRVSSVTGAVTLTVPTWVKLEAARDFAQQQSPWLVARLAERPGPAPVVYGAKLPLEGQSMTLSPGEGKRIQREGALLFVPGPEADLLRRLRAYVRALARDRLSEAVQGYAPRIGRDPTHLTLRDTRSRWGSCSSAGRLMFSWRLAMAPPEVLRYVAAHEVAHLREMNHGPAFWRLVAALEPDYGAPQAWLRENGPSLHRYLAVA